MSGKGGKQRRTAPATLPGAVSVPAGREPDVEEPDIPTAPTRPPAPAPARAETRESADASAKERARRRATARATVPGAVNVDMEEPMEPALPTAESARDVADRQAKERGRRTARAAVVGAVSVDSASMEPAEAVTTERHAREGEEAAPIRMTRPIDKKKRHRPAAAPGAVRVGEHDQGTETRPSGKVRTTPASQPGVVRVEEATTTTVAAYGMSKPARVSTGTVTMPGAVMVEQQVTQATSHDGEVAMGTIEQDAAEKDKEKAMLSIRSMDPGAESVRGAEPDDKDMAISRKVPTRGDMHGPSRDSYMHRMEEKVKQMEIDHGEAVEEPDTEDPIAVAEDPKKEWDEERSVAGYHIDDEEAGAVVTADAGMAGMPGLEYGTIPGGGNAVDGVGQGGYDDEHLAVAIAVQEGEEEIFLPAAVEYDPDAKPPVHKNRRFRLYFIAGILLLIVTCVGVGVGIGAGGDSGAPLTLEPTSAPTLGPTQALELDFRVKINSAFPQAADRGSPHDMAANWIMFDDPLALTPESPRLLQRYTIALFWFITTNNGESRWRSCNKALPGEDDNCEFQRFTRKNDDSVVYVGEPAFRWVSGKHECQWIGILCDEVGILHGIELFGQGISGTLPTEITRLEFLRSITFAYNEMTGTIPEAYTEVRHLVNLELHGNDLTGTIPSKFFDAEGAKKNALQNFNVGDNMLSGTISTQLGVLTDLKGLHLFSNLFTGAFPTEVGNLEVLSFTRNSDNAFAGFIPSEFGKLTLLQEFWMHTNGFSGTIPSELGQLSELTDFRVNGNKLVGTIPEQLYNLSFLFRFAVHENLLTGTLSSKVGNLLRLEILTVSRNQLTGTLPVELAQVARLRLAWLHLNLFSGSVPVEYCANVGPGLLEFLQSDCNPQPDPPVPCACCSACCDRSTEVCLITRDN